jgi:hypothetical protein
MTFDDLWEPQALVGDGSDIETNLVAQGHAVQATDYREVSRCLLTAAQERLRVLLVHLNSPELDPADVADAAEEFRSLALGGLQGLAMYGAVLECRGNG